MFWSHVAFTGVFGWFVCSFSFLSSSVGGASGGEVDLEEHTTLETRPPPQ